MKVTVDPIPTIATASTTVMTIEYGLNITIFLWYNRTDTSPSTPVDAENETYAVKNSWDEEILHGNLSRDNNGRYLLVINTTVIVEANTTKTLGTYTIRILFEKARKWEERGEHDVAATLLYDASIHVLKGDPSWRWRLTERVETTLEVDVGWEVRHLPKVRRVRWTLYGVLRAADGYPLGAVRVQLKAGEASAVVFTRDDGSFTWITELDYPPEEIHETFEAYFPGACINGKLYAPAYWTGEATVPLFGAETWFEVEDFTARWEGVTTITLRLRARLNSAAGYVDASKGQVGVEFTAAGLSKTYVPVVDREGRMQVEGHLFPSILSLRAWLHRLFGGTATVKMWYSGDWGHRPAVDTRETGLRPWWLDALLT